MHIDKLLFGIISGILLVLSLEIVLSIAFVAITYIKVQKRKKDGK